MNLCKKRGKYARMQAVGRISARLGPSGSGVDIIAAVRAEPVLGNSPKALKDLPRQRVDSTDTTEQPYTSRYLDLIQDHMLEPFERHTRRQPKNTSREPQSSCRLQWIR